MNITPRTSTKVVTPKDKNGKKIQKFLEKVKKQFSTESKFNSNETLSKRFRSVEHFVESVNNYLYVVLPKYSEVEWRYILKESNSFIYSKKPIEEYLVFMMSVTPKPVEKPKPKPKKEKEEIKKVEMEDLSLDELEEEEIVEDEGKGESDEKIEVDF